MAKAPLTVTADPKTKVQGSANPPLTATITGYVLGQNPATSGVTGAPDCTTTATTGSPTANYPITCTIGTLASANYSFGYVAGTLTVTRRTRRRRSRTSPTGPSTRMRTPVRWRSRSVTGRPGREPDGERFVVEHGAGAQRQHRVRWQRCEPHGDGHPAGEPERGRTITVTVSDGSLTGTDTFVLTVNSVNDVPSFTKGANQTAAASSGAQVGVGLGDGHLGGPGERVGPGAQLHRHEQQQRVVHLGSRQ